MERSAQDHLLSGACPKPEQLRLISTTHDRQIQSEALGGLARFRTRVQSSPQQALGALAASPEAAELAKRCILCGFWTPDCTKVKNHLRQAHVAAWAGPRP